MASEIVLLWAMRPIRFFSAVNPVALIRDFFVDPGLRVSVGNDSLNSIQIPFSPCGMEPEPFHIPIPSKQAFCTSVKDALAVPFAGPAFPLKFIMGHSNLGEMIQEGSSPGSMDDTFGLPVMESGVNLNVPGFDLPNIFIDDERCMNEALAGVATDPEYVFASVSSVSTPSFDIPRPPSAYPEVCANSGCLSHKLMYSIVDPWKISSRVNACALVPKLVLIVSGSNSRRAMEVP